MPLPRRELAAFTIAGMRVRFDPTWLILALLIAVTLTWYVFPALYEGLSPGAYFAMALVALFGLTLSIILHELGHSLVARAAGLPIHQITLFVFGGAAELEEEPADAKTELLMSLAGPAVSVVIGGVLLGAYQLLGGRAEDGALTPLAVVEYLGILNIALAVFNMIPSFPLDGGRVLRAIVWMMTGDRYLATRRAVQVSQAFTMALMIIGVLTILGGSFAGLWWILLALFIRSAVAGAWQDAQARRYLAGRRVSDFMTPADTADAAMSVAAFVERRLYPLHHHLFPVLSGGRLVGAVGLKEVSAAPREAWSSTPVGDIARPVDAAFLAQPDESARDALARMARGGERTLVITDGAKVLGVVGAQDLLDHLQMRVLLEG